MTIPFLIAAAVITGPITGGDRGQPFAGMTPAALAESGYTESEFFISGNATSFKPAGPIGMDGMWKVAPDATAEYKIRLLVRRPADARKFNGIVVVEWLNVTALAEGPADFMQMQELLARQGYAWVGVGAQAAGVNAPRIGAADHRKQRHLQRADLRVRLLLESSIPVWAAAIDATSPKHAASTNSRRRIPPPESRIVTGVLPTSAPALPTLPDPSRAYNHAQRRLHQ